MGGAPDGPVLSPGRCELTLSSPHLLLEIAKTLQTVSNRCNKAAHLRFEFYLLFSALELLSEGVAWCGGRGEGGRREGDQE